MHRCLIPVCFGLLLTSATVAQNAASPKDRTAHALATTEPITLDGRLDEPAWQQAAVIRDFHQLDPVEYARPTQETRVRILYDEKNLYVGAELDYASREDITANIMVQQQRVVDDDRFALILDPFFDRRNGYLFEVNPNGIRGDALLENNNRIIADWDGIWFAETRIDDTGWAVELQIPLASLSFDPAALKWGINFFRNLKNTQEFLAWSSQGRQNFSIGPGFAGTLNGLQGIRQGAGLDVVPAVSLKRTDKATGGSADFQFEPSLDVTYKLSSAMTASLTLNTDFSATEVDDRQINLTRFSLFFPEKRKFFLQDAGIFDFRGNFENGRPFFSRTIGLDENSDPVDLVGGLKITGRTGPWGIGLLGVRQDATASLEAKNLFVGRTSYNVGDGSSIGMIVTDGDPRSNNDASTYGADYRFRFKLGRDRIAQGEIWAQQTDTEGLDGDDQAYGAWLLLPDDRHFGEIWAFEFQDNYNPAMGFVNRTGIRDYSLFYRFRTRPQDGYWLAHNHSVWINRITDLDNRVKSQRIQFVPWAPFSRQSDFFQMMWIQEREVLNQPFDLFGRVPIAAGDYRFNRYRLRAETSEWRKWVLDIHYEGGDFFDGKRDEVALTMSWKPSPRFNIQSRLSTNDVRLPGRDFTARLMRIKTQFAFNSRWSWTALAQFDNVSNQLGLDTRLRWIPRAGQDLFIVYNRGLVRDENKDFSTVQEDVVVKGVYTFRF